MTWIVIRSKTNTGHVQVKQLKRQKKKKISPEEYEPQYKFQVQSARSQHFFDIDTD